MKGLETKLGSIKGDACWGYGCETPSAGPESWTTVVKLSYCDGIEAIEVIRAIYEGSVSGRDV